MTRNEKEALLRRYAAGEVTWHALQRQGIDNFREVLAGLGELGLRPPVAPMEGPTVAARRLGREMVRRALEAAKPG